MKKKHFLLLNIGVGLCMSCLAQTVTTKEIGNLVVQQVPDLPQALVERYEQYQNVRESNFADWDSQGEGIYISTRFGDVAQIHHVSAPGAYRRQLTFYKELVNNAQACPDPARGGFLFGRDKGGDEIVQYYWFDAATGRVVLLTDGQSRHGFARWNERGNRIMYSNYRRNGRDVDFYMRDMAKPEIEIPLRENTGNRWWVSDWSDDDKKMIIFNVISVNQAEPYLFDLETKKTESITPSSSSSVGYGDARFSKNGKGIYLTSDAQGEFQNLYYYDLESKLLRNLTSNIPWDVEGFDLSKDGKYVIFSTNEGGYSRLYLLETSSGTYRAIAGIPQGYIGSMKFHRDSRRVAVTVNAYDSPNDVYVLDVLNNRSTRWTFSEIGGLQPANFVAPVLIHYPSFDGLQIPAFLYTPKNALGKTPVVISIHGGPEGQSLPTFNSVIQFWVSEMGMSVLVPNVRGSTGYGKTYVRLDNGFQREDAVKDIGSLLDWIAKQSNLDAGRVAVYGGSYGGYMSLACMTHFNDRLRCGIDLFGISNFETFLKNTGAYRQDSRRAEYGDEQDPKMSEFLRRISPLTNIGNISKPIFIYQGKNDSRVPLSESEQMRDALRAKGNEVWYVMAKDEGHGLAKKNNRDYTQVAIALFLKQYLE